MSQRRAPDPVNTSQKLQILQMWDVSMKHITEEDADRLHDQSQLAVIEYDSGFFVRIPSDGLDYVSSCLAEEGLSPAVVHIVTIAHAHKIGWVHIAPDGEIYDFLNQFHW